MPLRGVQRGWTKEFCSQGPVPEVQPDLTSNPNPNAGEARGQLAGCTLGFSPAAEDHVVGDVVDGDLLAVGQGGDGDPSHELRFS